VGKKMVGLLLYLFQWCKYQLLSYFICFKQSTTPSTTWLFVPQLPKLCQNSVVCCQAPRMIMETAIKEIKTIRQRREAEWNKRARELRSEKDGFQN